MFCKINESINSAEFHFERRRGSALTSRSRQQPRRTDTLSSRKQSCSRKVRPITRVSARRSSRRRRRDAEGAPRAVLYEDNSAAAVSPPRAPPPLQRNHQPRDKTKTCSTVYLKQKETKVINVLNVFPEENLFLILNEIVE